MSDNFRILAHFADTSSEEWASTQFMDIAVRISKMLTAEFVGRKYDGKLIDHFFIQQTP